MVPLLPPGAIEPDPAGTFGLKPCPKHHPGAINHPDFEPTTSAGPDSSSGGQVTAKPLGVPFGKITGSLKSMATDTIKSTAGNLAANLEVKSNAASTGTGAAGTASSRKSVSKVLERYERRINDELNKLFNESQSLYFSLTGDITNSLQVLSLLAIFNSNSIFVVNEPYHSHSTNEYAIGFVNRKSLDRFWRHPV